MESVVRLVLTHRRILSAALVALAVWSALTAVTHSPDSREVLVAARDLDSGAEVGRADLQTRRLPRSAVPVGAAEAADVTGRTLAGAMRRGEVFTDRRVVDPRDLGADRVLSVVEVSAATGDLLRPGDAVDIVAVADEGAAQTVARGVEVVTVRADADRDAATLGLATGPKIAAQLARASMTSRLAAVVVARR